MNKKLWSTSLVLCLAATIAVAQSDKKPAGKSAPTGSPKGMQMPTPSPEMTKLAKDMAGTWAVSEKHFPSPMMPNGGTGKGTATFTPGPGNLSVVEKYHSVGAMGGNFNGMGVFWWDQKIQAYRGLWCDNMTPGGCDSSGTTKWDGDKLVGTMEMDMGTQKMAMRFVYSDFKPNSFVMTMEMGSDANSLKKTMEVTYTKRGAANAKMEQPAQ